MSTFNPGGGIYTAPPNVIAEFDHPELETIWSPTEMVYSRDSEPLSRAVDIGNVALNMTELWFHLSRRCDAPPGFCKHCMNGEPQPIDMQKSDVDQFFARNHISNVTNILFTGGNPELSDLMPYIAQKVIDYGVRFDFAHAIVPGTRYNQSFVDGLNILRGASQWEHPDESVFIGISKDKFHAPTDPDVEQKYREAGILIKDAPGDKITETDLYPLGRSCKLLMEYYDFTQEEMAKFRRDYLKERIAAIAPIISMQTSNGIVLRVDDVVLEANGSMSLLNTGEHHERDRVALCDYREESIVSALYRQGLVKENQFISLFRKCSS